MKYGFQIAGITLLAVFATAPRAGAAYVASLANDFTLASNDNDDTWSYRLSAWQLPVVSRFDYLLPENTRSAQDVLGVTFSPSPLMRSQTVGYWGIGKNSTGGDLTSGALTWPNGTVMLHPDFTGDGQNTDPSRMVISWLAPSAMTINAVWQFEKLPGLVTDPGPDGDGVGIEINTVLNGVGATAVGFANPSTAAGPISGSLLGLTVAAGDRIYWSVDNWPSPAGDMTLAAITITQVPEPSTMMLLGVGCAAFVALKRRR